MRYKERDQEWVDNKRKARMERYDAMPPAHRELVQEYGMPVVDALVSCGVTRPNHMRHIVETVLNEFSPTRGSYSAQGHRGQGNR